jgi:hypothetical protein
MGISKGTAQQNRQKRMQEIDLSGYSSGFPITPPANNKARIENVNHSSSQAYHIKLHQKSEIPVVFLHDPLGIAMRNVGNYYDALTDLKFEIDAMQYDEYFKTAVPAYHTFFNQDLWNATIEQHGRQRFTIYKKQGDGPDLLRKCASSMDENYLRTLLKVEKRKTLRKTIRKYKTIHVEWLEGKYNGTALRTTCSDFVSVNQALLDYAELPAPNYIALWGAIHALIHFVGMDPCSMDGGLDLMKDVDAPKRKDDIGVKYLDSLLDPSHPLYKAIFPSKQQIDEFSKEYHYEGKAPEPPDGQGKFRPAAFAACMVPTFAKRETLKYFDDIIKSAERIVADIVSLFKEQWEHTLAGKTSVDATVVMRLVKAANFPDLKGLHLVHPGSNLDNAVVLSGNVSVYSYLTAVQAQGMVTQQKQKGFIEVVDPTNKHILGYMAPDQLPNNKGAPLYIDKAMWDGLFTKNTEGVATARASLMVVSPESRYAQEWYLPGSTGDIKVTRTVEGLKFAGKVLPPAVAVMEMFNLASIYENLTKKVNIKGSAEFFISALGLAHATVTAAIAIAGEERMENVFKAGGNKLGKSIGKVLNQPQLEDKLGAAGKFVIKGKIKFLDREVPFLGGMAVFLTGVGVMFACWDAVSRFRADDDDAGAAYLAQVVALSGLTVAMLVETGALFLGMGPIGWAFLLISILASIVAYMLTDTDLEQWAKHGPFGNGNHGMPSGLYKNADSTKIYQAFMTLLMSPGIQIESDPTTYPKTVIVTAIVPGFQAGKSTITLESTYQSLYKMSPEERAMAINAGYGAQVEGMQNFTPESSQHVLHCVKWEPVYDDKTRQEVGVKYYYTMPEDRRDGDVKYHIRSRVRHITEDQIVIPTYPDKPVISSYTDQIDKAQNGWAYQELTLFR